MTEKKWYLFLYNLTYPIGKLLFPSRFYGRENVPEGAALICPIHSSNVDPFLVSHAMGKQHFCRHMAKDELRKVPVFGKIMEKAGSIFVRRGEQDIEGYRRSIRALKAGEKLMVFPEGTRVHGGDETDAKTGVIRMAAKTHVPLVPVYIPRDKKLFHRINIVIGEPYYIENAAHGDYERLAEELMDRIWALKR